MTYNDGLLKDISRLRVLTDLVSTRLNGMHESEFWFQRDNATCYIMHDTIHFLRETFEERIISRILPVETGSHVQAISWPYEKSLHGYNRLRTIWKTKLSVLLVNGVEN